MFYKLNQFVCNNKTKNDKWNDSFQKYTSRRIIKINAYKDFKNALQSDSHLYMLSGQAGNQ